jgi:hypothetical protein
VPGRSPLALHVIFVKVEHQAQRRRPGFGGGSFREGQTQVGSQLNVGRTAAKAVALTALAGPLGLLAAGSRTNGKITVTWMKQG